VIAMAATPPAPGSVRDVIRIPSGVPRPGAEPPRASAGRVNVTRFTPNTLEASVEVQAADGGWLIYADAADAGWHASIDGAPTRLYEANLAFKAVRVPAGTHVVRFVHRRGLHHAASGGVALLGLGWTMGLVALAFGACFPRRR
jgi:hypothetical protein